MKKMVGNPWWSIVLLVMAVFFLSCGRGGSRRWSKEWEQKFESFQPSDKIIEIIGVQPGMAVGEIGAASGRFAVKVAAKVGPAGRVYANDIDGEAIEFMTKRIEREGITNVVVVHGRQVEPGFPEGQLDLVYIINTYDELLDPVTLLRNIRRSLKPGGRLAVISYDPTKLKDHHGHAVAKEVVIDQAKRAGYQLVHLDTSFVYDNIYIFDFE